MHNTFRQNLSVTSTTSRIQQAPILSQLLKKAAATTDITIPTVTKGVMTTMVMMTDMRVMVGMTDMKDTVTRHLNGQEYLL